jgi:hypothetical protein
VVEVETKLLIADIQKLKVKEKNDFKKKKGR